MKIINRWVSENWLCLGCALLPFAMQSQTIIFSDNFDSNTIDTNKWTTSGYTIQETNGYMRVGTDATDNGGLLMSAPLLISPTGDITITRNVLVHYANENFVGDICIRFGNLPWTAVYYANATYSDGVNFLPRYGTYIGTNIDAPEGAHFNLIETSFETRMSPAFPILWDAWFNERIIYSPATGNLQYFVNDQKITNCFIGTMPVTNNPTIKFGFRAWGWFTGHEQLFDTILVTQNDLLSPPAIVTPPTNQAVVVGSSAHFTVFATGTAPFSYQWRKNGLNIAAATNATLALNSVGASASAGYSVVVWNAYGSVVSDTAYLSVLTDGANGNQPAQIPPRAGPVKPPAVDSLVVVAHGFQLYGSLLDPPAWVNTLASAIQQESPANWLVYPYTWNGTAWTTPDQALIEAWIEGGLFGDEITKRHWQQVHIIGHSAGAGFVEGLARKIREVSPDTVIHCTFLDPYLSVVRIGESTYGDSADWSDCYFAQDWTGGFTSGKLAKAHNVDVSWLDPNHKTVAYRDGQVAFSSHEWPHDFYLETVQGTQPACAGLYGFPLTQEANGWGYRWSYLLGQEPTIPCGPPGAVTNPDLLRVEGQLLLSGLANAFSSGVSLFTSWFTMSGSSSSPVPLVNDKSGGPVVSSGGPTPKDIGSGPAWLAVGVPVSNAVNFVQFDLAFTSTNGAEGLMTVYWNTNEIGMVDERVADAGLQTYRFALPGTVTNGLYTLSFRLDSFNNTASSVAVTNVMTGFVGLDQPIKLEMILDSNSAPVLKLTGTPNYIYLVQSSTNLTDWTPLALLVNTNGTVMYGDPSVTNPNARFYRAVAYSPFVPDLPTLTASLAGNDLLLAWPTNYAGFTLEYATDLPPTTWTSNSILPAVLNGQYMVTNSISSGAKFYRLRK